MGLRQPLNEFPIARRKLFLLVRRQPDGRWERPDLRARAGAVQVQLNGQAVSRRLLLVRLGPANRAQESARGIEVRWFGWEGAGLQLPDKLLLPRRVLHLRKAVEVGVSAQLRRQRTLRA